MTAFPRPTDLWSSIQDLYSRVYALERRRGGGVWKPFNPSVTSGSLGSLGICDGYYRETGQIGVGGTVDVRMRVAPGAGFSLDVNTIYGYPVSGPGGYQRPYLQDATLTWLNAGDSIYDGMITMGATGVQLFQKQSNANGLFAGAYPSWFNAGDLAYLAYSYIRGV